ncbi:hypothetical protein HII13_002374 [Brettanomyces bruxellensis]|nr:hypothetical protein HII13_002374 [Brettanomyces bruxellensis]
MSQSSIQETSFEIKVSGPSLIKRRGNARVASDHVDALAEISQLSDFERSFCATIDNAKSAGNFQKEESDSNKSRNESLMPLNQPYDNTLLDIPYSSITKVRPKRHQVWSVLYIVLIQGILTISRFQNFALDTLETELESANDNDDFIQVLKQGVSFDDLDENLEIEEKHEHKSTSLRNYDKLMKKFKGMFLEAQRGTAKTEST